MNATWHQHSYKSYDQKMYYSEIKDDHGVYDIRVTDKRTLLLWRYDVAIDHLERIYSELLVNQVFWGRDRYTRTYGSHMGLLKALDSYLKKRSHES